MLLLKTTLGFLLCYLLNNIQLVVSGFTRSKVELMSQLSNIKLIWLPRVFTNRLVWILQKTFSLVFKLTIIHTILILATMYNWPIYQLDVKNAFLQGYLTKEAFMKQPPGFINLGHSSYVCCLIKAIYGFIRCLEHNIIYYSHIYLILSLSIVSLILHCSFVK